MVDGAGVQLGFDRLSYQVIQFMLLLLPSQRVRELVQAQMVGGEMVEDDRPHVVGAEADLGQCAAKGAGLLPWPHLDVCRDLTSVPVCGAWTEPEPERSTPRSLTQRAFGT